MTHYSLLGLKAWLRYKKIHSTWKWWWPNCHSEGHRKYNFHHKCT